MKKGSEFNIGQMTSPLMLVKLEINRRDGVVIHCFEFIEFPIIDAHSKRTIFFLHGKC